MGHQAHETAASSSEVRTGVKPALPPVEGEELEEISSLKRFETSMRHLEELWTTLDDLAVDQDIDSLNLKDGKQDELDAAFHPLFEVFGGLHSQVLNLIGDTGTSPAGLPGSTLDSLSVISFSKEPKEKGSVDYVFMLGNGNEFTNDTCCVTFHKIVDESGKVHLSYDLDSLGRRTLDEREALRKDFLDTAKQLVPSSLQPSYNIEIPATIEGESDEDEDEPTDRNTLHIWYNVAGDNGKWARPVNLYMDFAQGQTVQIDGWDQEFPLEKKDSLIKVALFCSYVSAIHEFSKPDKDFKQAPFQLDEQNGLKWMNANELIPEKYLANSRSFAEEIRMFHLTPEEVAIAQLFMNHQWARNLSPNPLVSQKD